MPECGVAVDPADPETSAPGRHTPADWRAVLDRNALRASGSASSCYVGGSLRDDEHDRRRKKAALRYFTDRRATIVEMGVTVGRHRHAAGAAAPAGDILRRAGDTISTVIRAGCAGL